MATFIVLGKYTHQGITSIRDSPKRLDNARKGFQSMGGSLKSFYLTLGRYDLVTIVEAPDDETAAKMVIATAAQGNVATETLRAFTEDEYRKLIGALP